MEYVLELFEAALDTALFIIFLNTFLRNRKKQIPLPLFLLSFIFAVSFLTILGNYLSGDLSMSRIIITVIINTLTIFALTFLYETSLVHRIVVSITYQIMASLSESIIMLLISQFRPNFFELDMQILECMVNVSCSIEILVSTYFLGLLLNAYFRKTQPLEYHILLFITPLLTFIITTFVPSRKMTTGETNSYFIMVSILCVLNIVNYFLLTQMANHATLTLQLSQMEQQVLDQKDKYEQLYVAHRNTRKIIHDTKKHQQLVEHYIQNQDFDVALRYLKTFMEELENNHTDISTGNMVVDTLVSNHKRLAESEGILFTYELQFDYKRIPLPDYDFCIIIGNLLDNCLNACRQIDAKENTFIRVYVYMDSDQTHLIIKTQNSCTPKNTNTKIKQPNSISLFHGYGLENIRNTVESYKGNFVTYQKENIYETLSVIPILSKDEYLKQE